MFNPGARSLRGAGMEFMRGTELGAQPPSDQMLGRPPPPLEVPYTKAKTIIPLPAPEETVLPATDLLTAIEERESIRKYTSEPLTLPEIGFLLWCTQGVRRVVDKTFTLRTVPSAGARHAFETYLLVNRVEGVPPGLYRYLALEHRLAEESRDPGIARQVAAACLDQPHIPGSAVTFLWTAVADRMTWRYGERGYRYLHLDAGHVCQNLYLAALSVGCGVCAIGAFDDAAVNRILGIDGERQFLIYAATVGKKP
ncbi:SagB/ThcOx family dehydrogenase [Methanoculleus sp. FWC-SCC3]|uniref:SagB/ThcOx family dehydrogenase n=1 Tax=Methanoculleus methanifontis TaxID=2584086 RepID=A0ABT8LZJ5_9EURY|nr:SagB/ThcOx family dehydrogenase [Methanoculleus sp. FWC-SCC3]MDN7012082.1 SagB/ThcOx family dehydrogenase [Methanoculleus sp. FWC-SCC3]